MEDTVPHTLILQNRTYQTGLLRQSLSFLIFKKEKTNEFKAGEKGGEEKWVTSEDRTYNLRSTTSAKPNAGAT
jgi:hypothetical protein